jgi:peptide/nickel transport system permease protein
VAVIISLRIAVPLGTLAAVKRRTLADDPVTTSAVAGISMPRCCFAMLCVLCFALSLGWLSAAAGDVPTVPSPPPPSSHVSSDHLQEAVRDAARWSILWG